MSPEGEERGRQSRKGSPKGRLGVPKTIFTCLGCFLPLSHLPNTPTLTFPPTMAVFRQPARLSSEKGTEPLRLGVQNTAPLCVTSHLRGLYDRTAAPTWASAGGPLPQGGFPSPPVTASTCVDISLVPFNAINATQTHKGVRFSLVT